MSSINCHNVVLKKGLQNSLHLTFLLLFNLSSNKSYAGQQLKLQYCYIVAIIFLHVSEMGRSFLLTLPRASVYGYAMKSDSRSEQALQERISTARVAAFFLRLFGLQLRAPAGAPSRYTLVDSQFAGVDNIYTLSDAFPKNS